MRTNCFLLALAITVAVIGMARGQATFYGPPYDCYTYYTCGFGHSCAPVNGQCGPQNNIPYNQIQVIPQYVGLCVEGNGNGCVSFNGNATCTYTKNYNVPPGQQCNANNQVCGAPNNNASGCENGDA